MEITVNMVVMKEQKHRKRSFFLGVNDINLFKAGEMGD